jgi:hypothetical protein
MPMATKPQWAVKGAPAVPDLGPAPAGALR